MSKQRQFAKVELLGVEVDALTIDQAVETIITHAVAPDQPAVYVVKPYVEFLDRAAGDDGLRQILNQAQWSLADGVALLWAAHYLYGGQRSWWRLWLTLARIVLAPDRLKTPLPQRIAGINFTWPLLQQAAKRGASVFLIGTDSPATIEATAATLKTQLPDLHIIGARCGRDPSRPPGEVSEGWLQETLDSLQHAQPDLVLVGMGFPLQERVIARWTPALEHGVLVGEGGTFDYEQFGGHRRKAPRFLQQTGLEWLWRLILQPARWRRQLAIPRFIYRVWRSRHQAGAVRQPSRPDVP